MLLETRLPAALNGTLELVFDGELEPSGVTPRSVLARDGTGRPLPVVARARGQVLAVQLVLDEARLADPPAALWLQLAGDPSPHALGSRDGRRLPASRQLRLPLPAWLSDGGPGPNLRLVDGQAVSTAPRPLGATLHLTFEGVLDPATLRPEAFPLEPLAEGALVMAPRWPDLTWRLVGRTTEVWLTPPAGAGRLQLQVRRLAVRGLEGQPVEPLIVLEWDGG